MRHVGLSACIGLSVLVAVLLGVGVVRETTGQPWQTPPPTATARVIEVTRLRFVEITQTPPPTPYTETTYRRAQEAGLVPTFPPTPTPRATATPDWMTSAGQAIGGD